MSQQKWRKLPNWPNWLKKKTTEEEVEKRNSENFSYHDNPLVVPNYFLNNEDEMEFQNHYKIQPFDNTKNVPSNHFNVNRNLVHMDNGKTNNNVKYAYDPKQDKLTFYPTDDGKNTNGSVKPDTLLGGRRKKTKRNRIHKKTRKGKKTHKKRKNKKRMTRKSF